MITYPRSEKLYQHSVRGRALDHGVYFDDRVKIIKRRIPHLTIWKAVGREISEKTMGGIIRRHGRPALTLRNKYLAHQDMIFTYPIHHSNVCLIHANVSWTLVETSL
jgi:hypothetical protein